MEKENQILILVPENWLKSLLEDATAFEKVNEEWEYGKSIINDRIHFKAVALMGYAKSASSVMKYNKKIESSQAKNISSNLFVSGSGCVHPHKKPADDGESYWCKDCEQYVM